MKHGRDMQHHIERRDAEGKADLHPVEHHIAMAQWHPLARAGGAAREQQDGFVILVGVTRLYGLVLRDQLNGRRGTVPPQKTDFTGPARALKRVGNGLEPRVHEQNARAAVLDDGADFRRREAEVDGNRDRARPVARMNEF